MVQVRRTLVGAGVIAGGLALALLPACREADPTAPANTTMTINANPPAIALNGVSTITVIATREDGVPVVEGTVINMTTTLGTIPEEIYTKDGVATAELRGGTIAGEATVTAVAGNNAAVTVTVKIGTTSTNLSISANPGSLPAGGGRSTITVIAYDENSVPLSNVPVQFSTDHGFLSSGGSLLRTDSSGVVTDVLDTEVTATVTATSGDLVATVTVTVAAIPPEETNSPSRVVVTATPATVSPGQPSYLTATVFDSAGAPFGGAGVVFGTTAGSLTNGGRLQYTNGNGQAFDVLYTNVDARVTATSGAVAGSVDVTVSTAAATLTLTANPAQISSCTDIPVLTATLLDVVSAPIPGVRVNFNLESGSPGALSITSGTTDANGQAFSTLIISGTECAACMGSNTCQSIVTATASGLTDSFTVLIRP